jgi:CIC family chloride channel protein
VEVLETITVGEIMEKTPEVIRSTDTLKAASETLMRTHHHGFPVVNEQGELTGIFTLKDLDHTQVDTWSTRTVGELCTQDVLVAYPDETMGDALRRMGARDVGRLPVVSRDDPRRMVGVLRRTDLVRAYDLALTRRATMRHRAHQVRLGATNQGGVSIDEIVIELNAPCAGRRVGEVTWPRDCIIASVRRGRIVRIPHGDTLLRPGDTLVAVSEGEEARHLIYYLCHADGAPKT